MGKQFYVQDTRYCVGNVMLWWKQDDAGYVCDVRKAKAFTADEIDGLLADAGRSKGRLKTWPKEYIDERVSHHVRVQDCRNDDSGKET